MRLVKIGKSPWTLLVDKSLMREPTWTSTTTGEHEAVTSFQSWVSGLQVSITIAHCWIFLPCRLDETLQAMNIDSVAKSPLYKRQGGEQNLRELVNPNIKQRAPEVSHFLHTVSHLCLPLSFCFPIDLFKGSLPSFVLESTYRSRNGPSLTGIVN